MYGLVDAIHKSFRLANKAYNTIDGIKYAVDNTIDLLSAAELILIDAMRMLNSALMELGLEELKIEERDVDVDEKYVLFYTDIVIENIRNARDILQAYIDDKETLDHVDKTIAYAITKLTDAGYVMNLFRGLYEVRNK